MQTLLCKLDNYFKAIDGHIETATDPVGHFLKN